MDKTTPVPPSAPASAFHSGNTCPHCQETITPGQLIVNCPQCSSVHHESCWLLKSGCSSYHCDTAVRNESAGVIQPEITIGAEELKHVRVPPPPPKRSGQEVAAAYLPPKPVRVSMLAVASVVLALIGLIGVAGPLTGRPIFLAVGIGTAIVALTLGVLAMIRVNNPAKRRSGFWLAGIGTLAPCVLIVGYFILLGSMAKHLTVSQKAMDLKLKQSLPSELQLERMSAPARNAMRANVVLKSSDGFLSGMRYGSGVVIKLDQNSAYIITNKHVIGSQKSGIRVLFYNGEESIANVVWNAPGSVDIAIVNCTAHLLDKYKPVKIEESLIGLGDEVFAIGNPQGLDWSYSNGTISAVRNSLMSNDNVELYQTTTPINQGNSGGGLYRKNDAKNDGVLVGINTLTHDKSVSEGLSFAITTASIVKLFTAAERARFLGPSTPEINLDPNKPAAPKAEPEIY